MLCWGRKWHFSLSSVMFESYLNNSILAYPNRFLVRISILLKHSLSGHRYLILVKYHSICWHHSASPFNLARINMNELLIVSCKSKPRKKNLNLPPKENRILTCGAFWVPWKAWDCFNQSSSLGRLRQCLIWVMDAFSFLVMEEGGWWKMATPLLAQNPSFCPCLCLPLCEIPQVCIVLMAGLTET